MPCKIGFWAWIIASLVFHAATASASPCEDPAAGLLGPPELSIRQGELDAPRSPCVTRALFAHAQATALIDMADFYGTLGAGIQVGARVPFRGLEWSLSLRAVDWRFVQNASIAASETGLGPITLGVLYPTIRTVIHRQVAILTGVRLVVPFTDSTYDVPVGAVAGTVDAAIRLRSWLALTSHAAVKGWSAWPTGGWDGRGAVVAGAGASFLPWRWLGVHLGLEAQSGWFGLGLDHVLTRGGASVPLRKTGRIGVGAVMPLAGAERTNLGALVDVTIPM
ncbi:MAG: hypothetical protein HY698_07460 [Deltaproteobacteria bacterium]|nr:hypothetical protein [Deltaproteobacteria bacterium]